MRTRRQARRVQEAVSASASASQAAGLDSAAKLNNDYIANIDGILKSLRECSDNNKRMQERLEGHKKTLTDFMNEEDLSTRRKPKRWYQSLRPDCITNDRNRPPELVEAYERDKYAAAQLRPLSATRPLSREEKDDREGVEWAVVETVKEGLLDSILQANGGGEEYTPEVRAKIHQMVGSCNDYNEVEELATDMNIVVEIDWHRVYELLTSRVGKQAQEWRHCRTPACARALWQHHLAPGINTSGFNKDEDLRLYYIAEAHQGLDWPAIAAELGTNRTPCTCFQRYSRSLDVKLAPRTFTPEQDEMLMRLAERHGPGCWNEIAFQMGTGHLCPQLRQRHRILSAGSQRGQASTWTTEENKRLKLAVKMIGDDHLDWTVVAQLIPNRPNTSCRERYEKVRQESLGYDQAAWTEEESELLRALVVEFGPRWSLISQRFVKRSDNFLLRKWDEIGDEEEKRKIKEEREAMRTILRGGLNPDERPEILPSDFQLLHDATEEAPPPLPLPAPRPAKRARRQPRPKKKAGEANGVGHGGRELVDECIFGAVASIENAIDIIESKKPDEPTVAADPPPDAEEKTVEESSPAENEETRPEPEEGKSEAYSEGKAAAEIEKVAEKPAPAPKKEQLPLRQWLDENLVPVLVPALDAVARERPEDPVSFVAEYLLKHNPRSEDIQSGDEEKGEPTVKESEPIEG
ncbi:Myblike DNAbinding domain-containing protein [Perkinsus olseni]|uniref:Myblike DNAbinding domain-containing protein n=1 Tax=Perkinsus olseni TaxID=32597 RepID=A0A7J6PU78_PEROL|nr:Myblike DNAbinding domain-containing protein [Perkinsus olseni]